MTSSIEKDLDDMQNTVLDAMHHLTDDDMPHSGLSMHGLLTNLAADLAALDLVWQDDGQIDESYQDQEEMMDFYVYKMNKPKRKGGQKGSSKNSRKQSKNVIQTNEPVIAD